MYTMLQTQTFSLLFSHFTFVTSDPPLSTSSVLNCATICIERQDCSSFFYKRNAKSCYPSTVRYFTQSELTPAPGYRYYMSRPDCDADWRVFNGQCYQLKRDGQPAVSAQATCVGLGGFLAKADSMADFVFIGSFYTKWTYFWIGGSDGDEEGTWIWNDGSEVIDYVWEPGEPNNFNGTENCMIHASKGWNDENCDASHACLCEK